MRGGKITTFLFGGVNKQIEHHLFPSVHQNHLNKITPFVKKYCEQNNIPYKVRKKKNEIRNNKINKGKKNNDSKQEIMTHSIP